LNININININIKLINNINIINNINSAAKHLRCGEITLLKTYCWERQWGRSIL